VPETVLSSAGVPDTGDYFVSASVEVIVSAGDTVACYINGGNMPYGVADGPVANETYETIPLEADVPLSAGDSITVSCNGYVGGAETAYYTGTLDAILVDHVTS
jgi:hypothetical protein